MSGDSLSQRLLEIDNLTVRFRTTRSTVFAVNGVSLYVDAGECLAIIGESGSGKTVSMFAVLGLLREPPAQIQGTSVMFDGLELLTATERQRRHVRARELGMVFQDAEASLDPSMRVGQQIVEVLRVHDGLDRRSAKRRAIELLDSVDIPAPSRRFSAYPHELSGGMRQRAMIAIALALEPRMLIADEPTTALDTTIQAQILELLQERQSQGMSLVMITHDLGVAAQVAQRVAVMYAGAVVEHGSAVDVLERPAHPYTAGLLACTPNPLRRSGMLQPIGGTPPVLYEPPRGCPFAPRCGYREDVCWSVDPPVIELDDGRWSRCHFTERVFADGCEQG